MNVELKRLFDQASQLPSTERTTFIEQSCTDPLLRIELESLLQYATGSETVFDAPIRDAAVALRGDHEFSPGERIGAYNIVSLLGHGGMGAVYLAERADGAFQQQVALKVLQSGNAEFLLERFWQERRILALLNHPNIARILDGGQTPEGLPWFVMEYVPGEPIDRFCDHRHLTLNDRLELFLKVCDAVRHAHRSLIVHRDLKPANIFVANSGEPKLLDFGIAKVLDPGQVNSACTRLLTPEYASPEQIRGDPVTTATDIYSLGAVLYKMAAGRPPHSLQEIAPLQAARIITEEPVPRPSTVRPGIPADIDAILQKALHKDSARRYGSVEEFSQDIRRYLDGRPVLAAPDRFTYRARRFLKRNALVTTLGALAVLSLVAGSAISIDQARRAQRRFAQVRQLANVFLFDFDRSIQNTPGTLEARKLVASTARRYLEQLAAESAGDAGLQHEIATAYEQLGEIQLELQSTSPGESEIESLLRAYEIRSRLGDSNSPDVAIRAKFIALVSRLAVRYQTQRNTTEAARWDQEATRLAGAWVSSEPNRVEPLEAARVAFLRQGLRLETEGQSQKAREAMEKAAGFAERAWLADARGPDSTLKLVMSHYAASDLLVNMELKDAALPHVERAVALGDDLYRKDPANLKWRREYQQALSSAGIVHTRQSPTSPRDLSLAIQFLERARALAEKTATEDPKNARAKDDWIIVSQRLARALTDAGKLNAVGPVFEQSGRTARDLVASNPKNRRYWYLLASNQYNYGRLRMVQERYAEARELLLSADQPFEQGFALDPADGRLLNLRLSQLHLLALAAEKQGDLKAARDTVEKIAAAVTSMLRRDPASRENIDDYQELAKLAARLNVPFPR